MESMRRRIEPERVLDNVNSVHISCLIVRIVTAAEIYLRFDIEILALKLTSGIHS